MDTQPALEDSLDLAPRSLALTPGSNAPCDSNLANERFFRKTPIDCLSDMRSFK
ncbi:MAG: hypothetical protein ISN28_03895 [Ectothiorhodospiraceae bacterium AqS1]|nr:hypothetical protein [Ectothiorhodospiraceae bacterium AqS1]